MAGGSNQHRQDDPKLNRGSTHGFEDVAPRVRANEPVREQGPRRSARVFRMFTSVGIGVSG